MAHEKALGSVCRLDGVLIALDSVTILEGETAETLRLHETSREHSILIASRAGRPKGS